MLRHGTKLPASRCTWLRKRVNISSTSASSTSGSSRSSADARLLLEAYPELGLDHDVYSASGGVRTRQHVNPLKKELQQPPPETDWSKTYANVNQPLVIDLGCGPGRFLLSLAKSKAVTRNYLGIDIRNPIVQRANRWSAELQLDRIAYFLTANGTLFLDQVVGSYPGPTQLVCIQFPDPHFKNRHKKRRIVQPLLCHQISRLLPEGGLLFFQTDVEEVAEDARNVFTDNLFPVFSYHSVHYTNTEDFEMDVMSCIEDRTLVTKRGGEGASLCAEGSPWLQHNPIGIPTEREVATLREGKPVYRMLLQKSFSS